MKALKFIFSVLIIMTLVVEGIFAQDNNNDKVEDCREVSPGFISCVDEPVTGKLEHCWTIFKSGKIQEKWKGSLIGEVTGDVYTYSRVKNHIWKDWINGTGWTNTFSITASIVNETLGVEVGVVHYNYHQTNNANGEWTADVDNYVFECY